MLGVLKKLHTEPTRSSSDALVADIASLSVRDLAQTGLGQACMHGMAGIEWEQRYQITRPPAPIVKDEANEPTAPSAR